MQVLKDLLKSEERWGSIVECLTPDRTVAGSSLTAPEELRCVREQDTLSSA